MLHSFGDSGNCPNRKYFLQLCFTYQSGRSGDKPLPKILPVAFDSRWFCAGEQYPVAETEFGKVGMFICADGRLPEIVRCLSLQGADILLDLTNWVTSGFEKETLTNPQVEYMIPTRALENRVWIIAANKVGMEAKSILYCGKKRCLYT